LIWNLESNETDWNKDIRKHYQQHDRGTPQYYKGWWRKCFEVEAYAELFAKPEEKSAPWRVGLTEDQVSSAFKLLHSFYLILLPFAFSPLWLSSFPLLPLLATSLPLARSRIPLGSTMSMWGLAALRRLFTVSTCHMSRRNCSNTRNGEYTGKPIMAVAFRRSYWRR